ncbi:hypothetical protein B0H14DRAFT_2644637 [Mycena olivaceomarginata]|nr:hypothetical protein B0H14DRAFT_2644637 [Mycena olivaceomarginata]
MTSGPSTVPSTTITNPRPPATPKQQTPATPKKPGLTLAQRRRNEEHNARIEAEDKARIKRQEELAYLAATKPPLVPLSPQHAQSAVSSACWGWGLALAHLHSAMCLTCQSSPRRLQPFLCCLAGPRTSLQWTATATSNALATGTSPQQRLCLPATSDFELGPGHSRVFSQQQTPGAELFWSCNPQEVWQFITETHVGLE